MISSLCCCCSTIISSSNNQRIKINSHFISPIKQQDFFRSFLKIPNPKTRLFCLPKERREDGVAEIEEAAIPTKDFVTIAACLVGLFTGIGVVLFNTSARYQAMGPRAGASSSAGDLHDIILSVTQERDALETQAQTLRADTARLLEEETRLGGLIAGLRRELDGLQAELELERESRLQALRERDTAKRLLAEERESRLHALQERDAALADVASLERALAEEREIRTRQERDRTSYRSGSSAAAVHEIRDFFWDELPSRGASWLREEPLEVVWQRIILVPVCGGVIVGMLNSLCSYLKSPSKNVIESNVKGAFRPLLKAVAAAVTLGTGNSLGPEGPSVEIGSAIAKGVGRVFEWKGGRRLSLIASGSAAGISSGFNAAVAGCFFAVESVLWPSPADSSSSLANSTPMVILSSVIASVISEVGLGSDPAFTVPEYDFHSPGELPLYLLLGILCGMVSLTLSWCTSYSLKLVDNFHKGTGITKVVYPAMGGLTVGLIALAYPEVLYWGFENVDILLESRPFVDGLPASILIQLVGVKIIATSLSRDSGLVGGYYAPSLFIGAATGMAYGKYMRSIFLGPNPMFHFSILEVASPQAYGLVGMAATLAGVCQVPLTSVLLLFELTHDYRIVLPLLGAVGLSSWITSSQNQKREAREKSDKGVSDSPSKDLIHQSQKLINSSVSTELTDTTDLCNLESSLCVYDSGTDMSKLAERITVSQAMKTRYVTAHMSTSIVAAVTLMLVEKQSCAVIIDSNDFLVGMLELEDIQEFSRVTRAGGMEIEEDTILVSDICGVDRNKCQVWTATPDMTLLTAEWIMDSHGVNKLPVVSEQVNGHERGHLIRLLDRECISIACRAVATKEFLSPSSMIRRPESSP